MMDVLGKKLKLLRIQKSWNQEDVARRLDISIPAYSKIENGITDINLSRLEQLARLYDLSVIQLLTSEQVRLDEVEAAHRKLLEREAQIVSLQKQLIVLFEELRASKAS